MSVKVYLIVTMLLFLSFAAVHFCRLFQGWSMVMGGLVLPLWGSYVVVLIALLLIAWGIQLFRRL